MSRSFAEILLFIPMVLNTGFLTFIAGVIQGIMNDMAEAEFKGFLTVLHKHATKSPYAIIASTFTFVGVIPYFIAFGFTHWWFTAGIVLWFVASIISKRYNLPIYERIFALENSDTTRLNEERQKLQTANRLRALLSFASIGLVVIGFI